jgi:nickel-type superoxide dismutase maturation protease
MDNEFPIATWKDRILFFLGRRKAFLVEGDSMLPTLKSGDVVLLDEPSDLKVGHLVLADHPFRSSARIIKRITEMEPDGRFVLTGDNASDSTDSRTFGAVSIELILGRVVCRLK